MELTMEPRQVAQIDVALATYNGGPFIAEMLASIAAQDYPDIRILVSDDGSSDETISIVEKCARSMSVRLVAGRSRKGVLRNFEAALSASNAPYIALCDQDDYWMPDKLSTLHARLEELEAMHGRDMPLLVFSDIEVVDKTLGTIKASMYDGSVKTADARRFEDFFFSSHVPGCAMMFNRALLNLALPFPEVEIHDWWIIQLATLFGRIDYVDRPLIKYRQHGNNAIGLGNPGTSAWGGRLQKLARPFGFARQRLARWQRQASSIRLALKALKVRFGTAMPENARLLVEAGLEKPSFGQLNGLLRNAKTGEWGPDYLGILYLLGRTTGRDAGADGTIRHPPK